MDTKNHFSKITVIGLGLIGSSICKAAKSVNLVEEVIGCDVSSEVMKVANELNIADNLIKDPLHAVKNADIVFLAIPVGSIPDLARLIINNMKPGSILTDTGSVKSSILRELQNVIPETIHFIPAHPVAGTENSGPVAGFAELFSGRWCIFTPSKNADKKSIEKLKLFWTKIGSMVEIMTAEQHDLILAITSHLPHLIAYNIVGTADELGNVTQSDVIKFSAGGFRDFTRIASSNPIMWRDVFLNNKDAVLEVLGRFTEDLSELQKAIRWGDAEKLEETFKRTRRIRQRIIDAGQADMEDSKINS